MTYQTTLGWSVLTSGVVTIVLALLPGGDFWWGVGLLLFGLGILYLRRSEGLGTRGGI